MNRAASPPDGLAGVGARPRALGEKLGFALAALLLVVSLTLSAALAAYVKRALLTVGQENLEALAAQMARELSFGMDRFAREIELQATSPAFTDPAVPVPALRARLEAIQKTYPEFAHISVVEVPSGNVLAATGGIFEGGNGKGRPVFEEGQKELFVADVHDAVRLAALLPKPASGEPLRFLDIAAPIRDASGKTFRVLGAHVGWEWTRAMKQQTLAPVEAGRKVQLMLVDTAGHVTLPPDSSIPLGTPLAQLMGAAASDPSRTWADGQSYLFAEAPTFASGSFKGLGWRIVARQEMPVALAPAERLANYLVAGGLGLGILASALGWFMAVRLARPVSDFANAAAALPIGSNPSLPSVEGEPREVFRSAKLSSASLAPR